MRRPLPSVPIARTLSLLVLAGLALSSVCASAAAAPAPLRTGVSYSYSDQPLAFQHVLDTGSKYVQVPLRWGQVAPSVEPKSWNPEDPADPNYDWGNPDAWARHAVASGLTPIFQIRSAPVWAERCKPNYSDATCDPSPTALAAFTRAAVRRFSGSFGNLPRIRFWQGLNEPNLALFFEPQYRGDTAVSPELYRTLINEFYAAVKSVVPSNIVLAAGLGPIAVPGFTIGPMQFARQLLCMSGGRNPRPLAGCGDGVHFDIFDVHPYTTGAPSHKGGPNDVQLGDLGKLQRLLEAADRAGHIQGAYKRTPLWITEFAWDSRPPDPGGLPVRIARQWIPEALYEAWKVGVQNFMWFSLVDSEPEAGVPFNESLESGLYFWAPSVAAQKPKPQMNAFRFPLVAIRRANGLKIWGRTPNSKGGRVVLQAKHSGRWRNLGVLRAAANGIYRGTVSTAYGINRKGAVRARYRKTASSAFPMRRVGDFYQPPFGA